MCDLCAASTNVGCIDPEPRCVTNSVHSHTAVASSDSFDWPTTGADFAACTFGGAAKALLSAACCNQRCGICTCQVERHPILLAFSRGRGEIAGAAVHPWSCERVTWLLGVPLLLSLLRFNPQHSIECGSTNATSPVDATRPTTCSDGEVGPPAGSGPVEAATLAWASAQDPSIAPVRHAISTSNTAPFEFGITAATTRADSGTKEPISVRGSCCAPAVGAMSIEG